MPLTVSHPAVVLPLRRLGLPMTALVVAGLGAAASRVGAGLHAMAFSGTVMALLVGAVTVFAVCCAWQATVRTGGARTP